MPTAKPRVQVTLTLPQHETLRRLAALQKRSMSSVISELFETVLPALERVAVVLQAAVRAQDSQRAGLLASAEQTERDLRPLVAQAMGQLDLLQMDFEAAAPPPAKASRASLAGSARTPGVVTRGSGSQHPKPRRTKTVTRKRVKSVKRRANR
jgi:hypothetical protein